MTKSMTQIQCPNCSNPVAVQVEPLIDVGQDPAAKARFLSGSVNAILCPFCGYQGQIASPLVYHDPEKELLLTFMPVQVDLSKPEQEQAIGRLINQAVNSLPQEKRKAYLLQPQAVLTMQGMIERILEADGITKEQIEAQRAKMRLFEELLRTPEDNLESFVEENDQEMDETFFQIASLSLQATPDEQARQTAGQLLERVLKLSSYGKEILEWEAEVKAAAESLQEVGEDINVERLLKLLIDAPNEKRVKAISQITRPALDYAFFQMLSSKIEEEQEEGKEQLTHLRDQILAAVEEVDKAQEARASQAVALLRSLLEAPDQEGAIRQALPLIDELFLGILEANLRAARERKDQAVVDQLVKLDNAIRAVVRDSLPEGLQFAQEVLEIEDLEEAEALLEQSAERIDDDLLRALLATAQRLESSGDGENAKRLNDLHRKAVRISMRTKLQSD